MLASTPVGDGGHVLSTGTVTGMDHRDRLVQLVRQPDADLAEAALLCSVEADPDLDVDVALLRIDALSDQLLTRGFRSSGPEADAAAIASYLAVDLGFAGDQQTYHDPANALLPRVLDRKRGLPITLSMLWVAIARRVDVAAYPINLPGHVVVGVAGPVRPVVVDPFHAGILLDDHALARRLETISNGQITYHRAMLRPSSTVDVVRRLLNNLTRDYHAAGDARSALWTVELKLILPNSEPSDHRTHGDLLAQVGRFGEASTAYETYLDVTAGATDDAAEVRQAAIRARSRLN